MSNSTHPSADNSRHDSQNRKATTTHARDTPASGGPESAHDIKTLQKAVAGLQEKNLEPISAPEAIEMYIADRQQELRNSSLTTHRSALRFFSNWCSQEGIQNLNSLTGRKLHQYRVWRRSEAPTKVETLAKETEKTQQDILRQFIRYAESIDAVPTGLHEKVRSPSLTRDEKSRSHIIDGDTVQPILDYLDKYHYASLQHVIWALLANSGPRIGSLVGLDVDDYHPDAEIPHIEIRHRPEKGTQLKNGDSGERLVALTDHVCEVLDDFLEEQRPEVTDDYDRAPLLATQHGRIARSTIRKYVYQFTRPCEIAKDCPHNRDPNSCEATSSQSASKCPSSKSPHALRRGYITHELTRGVEPTYVSSRCNVSEAVIDQHYDERDQLDQMRVRQRAIREARSSDGSYGGGD